MPRSTTTRETRRAKAAKQMYLGMGLTRTLRKVAQALADDKLLAAAGVASTRAMADPKERAAMLKRLKADPDTLRQWERLWTSQKRQVKRWSSAFGWQQAAQDLNASEWDARQRTRLQAALHADDRHADLGVHLQLGALEMFDKAKKTSERLQQSVVQALALGVQTERVARGLASGRGASIGDVSGMLAQLNGLASNPAGALSAPPDGSDTPQHLQVNITQVTNETTITNHNTANLLQGPLTLDALKALDAQVRAELNADRRAHGFPELGSGEDPWSDSAVPPPPPGVVLTPDAPALALPAPRADIVEGIIVDEQPPEANQGHEEQQPGQQHGVLR